MCIYYENGNYDDIDDGYNEGCVGRYPLLLLLLLLMLAAVLMTR